MPQCPSEIRDRSAVTLHLEGLARLVVESETALSNKDPSTR
jgi:hypothetical protein